jgi:NAD(P)-dependent dehydrogenase (short-subunit alcohol dehydrogenase family)
MTSTGADLLFRYDGKRVLVTGASRGIGREIALAFARRGADVTIAARTRARLEQVADEIRSVGQRAWIIDCDLTDPGAAAGTVKSAAGLMGGLDILVNNAGGSAPGWLGPLEQATSSAFDAVFSLNVRSPLILAGAAIGHMKENGGGAILNIASIDGLEPCPGEALYGSAKAALISLTRALAIEVGCHSIRVNAIAPSLIETELIADWISTHNDWLDRASFFPINRLGTTTDVAAAAIYLCSDEAGWVSGIALPIAGGQQTTSEIFRWVRHRNPVPDSARI